MGNRIKAITLGLALAATAAGVQAQVININFTAGGRGSSVGSSYFMNGTANSMPASYSSTTWNDFVWGTATQATIANLLDTFGNATGIGVTLSGGSNYGGDAIGLPVLKEYRYFSGNASTVGTTVTLTNVPAGVAYDIYVLSQGNANGRTTRFSLGAGSLVAGTNYLDASPADLAATTWTDGGNYVKFGSVTSDVSGTIVIEAASLSGGNNGSLNGMQLVDLSAPEPDLYTAITPSFGATYVTNLPTIEVAVTNGAKNVDTASFTMQLVLNGVTNDVTSSMDPPVSFGNGYTFSYTPVSMLENGAEYTVLYSVAGIGGAAGNYISSFTTAPDLLHSTAPVDGALYVATNAEVSVAFTNVAVSLSNVYSSAELVVNSTDVSGDLAISYPTNGVMKFEYAHSGLVFGQAYDVQLNVFRTDGYTNTVEFSFDAAVDPSVYLIAPGIRNGGFELVDGAPGETAQIQISSARVDHWGDDTGAGAKTEAIGNPSEGTRALVTGAGSATYNIATNTISDGDIFEFKWTVPGRANGVSVGLAYDAGGSIVIVSNSLVYTSGTIGEFSGSYLFDSVKDAGAIGNPVGIVIIDDNTGGGAVYVDEVRLYYGNIAVRSVSPADGSTGVAKDSPIEVVIGESASQVDTNTLALVVDGVDVTADSVVSDTASGVTITYTPTNDLAVGRHFASVSADGTPAGTAAQSWSFLVDPTGAYLISPTLRNGSFELVGGSQGTGTETDWALIDDWSDNGAGTGAKTEDNGIATDGSRIFVTGAASETYNMTTTNIENGDRFGYSFVIVGRSLGLTAALAYDDGGSVVVVSNSMTFVNGGSTPQSVSGEYTFTAGMDPDAIGKPVGLVFIDDGAGSSAVQIDEVRLYSDTTAPTEQPVITDFSISGSTVMLSYTSQDLGLYSLQSKEDLVFAEWVTVLSNLPSGNLTTNLPTSGADQEFYRVISQ